MAGLWRGEIRWVEPWSYVGHEPTGDRPVLIISPDWFNRLGNAIVVPLTSLGPAHSNWWEPFISATDSRALAPDLRTVPASRLGNHVLGIADPEELNDVVSVIHRLTGSGRPASSPNYRRGDVWLADFSSDPGVSAPDPVNVLALHCNAYNGMAITMVITDQHREPGEIVIPVKSCFSLLGHSLLVSQVRSQDVAERFIRRVGAVPEEVDTAAQRLVRLLS